MINKEFNFLKYEFNDDIATLIINKEKALNALDENVIKEIIEFLGLICSLPLKGLIVTGAGEKAFIAGADIVAMANMTAAEAMDFALRGQSMTLMFEELRFPVIACVNGFALGAGSEVALACDFIYASENAVFGLPEVSLGLIPGFGGTQRLAKIIGRARAKELIFTGRKVKVEEALSTGLVLKSFANKEELLAGAVKTIERCAGNSPNAIGVAKFAINSGVDLGNQEGLKIEQEQFSALFGTDDMQEGNKAIMEKTKPNFR
jgi:enoyl-CoA hydratase